MQRFDYPSLPVIRSRWWLVESRSAKLFCKPVRNEQKSLIFEEFCPYEPARSGALTEVLETFVAFQKRDTKMTPVTKSTSSKSPESPQWNPSPLQAPPKFSLVFVPPRSARAGARGRIETPTTIHTGKLIMAVIGHLPW